MSKTDKKQNFASTLTLDPEERIDSLENHDSVPSTNGEDSQDAHLRQILKAMVAFREGDFSVRLPMEWSGIDGRIAEAFNQTIIHEDHTSREIARLSVTVGKEGRLKQRMSLPAAVGGWAVKADSINTLIDDLVRPTTDVARAIGAVAKGDLSQSMELAVDGVAAAGRIPSLGEARQHDDRATLGVHVGSDARGPRSRHRRQARRTGQGEGRVRRVEGSDRIGQLRWPATLRPRSATSPT